VTYVELTRTNQRHIIDVTPQGGLFFRSAGSWDVPWNFEEAHASVRACACADVCFPCESAKLSEVSEVSNGARVMLVRVRCVSKG